MKIQDFLIILLVSTIFVIGQISIIICGCILLSKKKEYIEEENKKMVVK